MNYLRLRTAGLAHRAHYSTSPIAFVFDIDGVLVRGSKPIPKAKEALELLNTHNVPFILLTNGGGQTETERVNELSSKIGIEISPLQLVQSHTPMKALVNTFKRVMVVGGTGDKVRKCAEYYGFKDVLMPIDLVRYDASVSPHHRWSKDELERYAIPPEQVRLEDPVDAVLMFNDPRDMGTDVQVVLDLLNSENGYIGTKRFVGNKPGHLLTKPAVPMIFSNNDFLWANDYKQSRFGQGAVRIIIEALYASSNNGAKFESLIMGKPFKLQYDYAHHVLLNWQERKDNWRTAKGEQSEQVLPELNHLPTHLSFEKIYMVGDNPASDIKGANDNGWESLLLRTGVYRDQDWETAEAHPTAGVFDNVYDSVTTTLKKHGYVG